MDLANVESSEVTRLEFYFRTGFVAAVVVVVDVVVVVAAVVKNDSNISFLPYWLLMLSFGMIGLLECHRDLSLKIPNVQFFDVMWFNITASISALML